MKVLFAASFGGHWAQLKRLTELLACDEREFVSTAREQHQSADYYLDDFSVRELWRGVRQLPRALSIVRKSRPDLIISTGAAPGLLVLFAGFLLGKKTLWVDSIANSRRLSLSGRVAKLFASQVLTQWPELATGRVRYLGRLL
ncbi:oligosaccharide biosynthesis protein Alg14 [Halomonas sp. M5N1S17]|uniref:oligosaccharide biosynthesis protein Alg14 n=1 Tax=Halomonas alkalisoli TaxID=2907158 RepID=UPI001F393FA8|nr:oligosaccharide biosynthesis protein Alg14 [Halomonas alkalisoli]MCE9662535.1 oligosaccharide biosynthesis protein Alg14 [Halomonas alkalisoli]